MSYIPVSPLMQRPRYNKGEPLQESCTLCGDSMRVGQLFSGVETTQGYVEGHYACVIQAIGTEETLLAIQEGRLPAINTKLLENGCLPFEYGGV